VSRFGWSLLCLLACGCAAYPTVPNGDFLLSTTTQLGYFPPRLDTRERHETVKTLLRNGASCSTRPGEHWVTRCAYAYCVDARPRILTWTVGYSVTIRTVRPGALEEIASVCVPHQLYATQNAYAARNGATLMSLDY
jgi:hypothetical protein